MFFGGAGNDLLSAGERNGTVSYADVSRGVSAALFVGSSITGGAGIGIYVSVESVIGSDFSNALYTGSARKHLQGLGTFDRSEGDDVLDGGDGDDLLLPGTDDDLVAGGEGDDTVSCADLSVPVDVVLFLGATDTLYAGMDTSRSIENVIDGSEADHLLGDASANRLQGGDG